MAIRTIEAAEHAAFVAFLNAGMRPEGSATRADDDFPVVLAPDNLEGLWGLEDARGWAAGLAVLVRPFATSTGSVDVAGIGSVVTRRDRRGEGLSRQIQHHVLQELATRGVPLAVLWTDQPEIYAGRGFKPAGWEYHVDLAGVDLAAADPPALVRPFRPEDTDAVVARYADHPFHTRRRALDHARLYSMPGTRGLVLERAGAVVAYAFCGKGADFPGYVAEWGGNAEPVLTLLAAVRDRGLAHRVLVPAGREDLLEAALARGAGTAVVPSGLWTVLRPDLLARCTGIESPADPVDAAAWLGSVDADGLPVPGRLALAVWGFDSV
jgi:GNAT superfamily N-acetyltransferase